MSEDHIKSKIKKAENYLRTFIKSNGYTANILSHGATDIDPKNLAFIVVTATDKQKQELIVTLNLEEKLKEILNNISYPLEAIPVVGLRVESEETIDRDFNGDWKDTFW